MRPRILRRSFWVCVSWPSGDGRLAATHRTAALLLAMLLGGSMMLGQSPDETGADPGATPGPPRFVRYLAESGTGDAFRTRIAIANPGTRTATVVLTFSRTEGAAVRKTLRIDPHSRATVQPELVAGLEAAEFSTTVESDEEVLVDRSTSKNGSDFVSHGEISVAAPSRTWFIADGTTHSGLNLFYVMHNPGSTAATVLVRYLLPVPKAPLSKAYTVGAGSRYTIWVNGEAETDPALAALASTEVSAAITATAPVIVERQTYLDRDGRSFAVGHGSPGIRATASTWFFAEGATGPTFEFSLTLVNPSASAAAVQALYRLSSGELVTRAHLVPPSGRAVIVVNQEDTRLANATVSVSLESTNGVEFAAERTLRWRGPTAAAAQEAHYGAGASATTTAWGFAEGEVGGGADTDTLLTLTNPVPIATTARVTLLFEDGSTVAKVVDLPAASRSALSLANAFPIAAEKRFSVLVQSLGDRPAGLTVEWSMYSRVNGSRFLPVMAAMATPLQTPPSTAATAADDRTVANVTATPLAMQSAAEAQPPASTSGAAITVTTVPAVSTPGAAVFNLQVVSDASPDLADLKRFVDSTTSRWTTSREKVWALFYWGHILKRQTGPIVLHGSEVTDPIRNFSDYGFTMCSTITGINQSLYEAIGLKHQYWDICNHTVSAVEYDGKFHMIDTSMSNLVTEDDGVTLATVEEAAAESARLVRERSLYSTSANGFLTGTDTMRNLGDLVNPSDGSVMGGFAADFCAAGLKYRDYYYNWNSGHRYVLNLREDESYTRYYAPLGSSSDYWVGSESVSAPDPAQTFENDASHRFGMRGNGRWTFTPKLTPGDWARAAYRSTNITADAAGGVHASAAGQPAEVIYKVQAANAITSQSIQAQFARTDVQASATLAVSVNQGATWTQLATLGTTVGSAVPLAANVRTQVNGAYETLVRIQMTTASGTAGGVILTDLVIQTITQVNTKALPKLNVGRNEIYVTLGDQSDTMVLWPDLRGDFWKKDVYASSNIASQGVSVPRQYTAVVYPAVLTTDAYLTYRFQAPTDISRLVYGGRLHNYQTGSYIDFLHSFDNGTTWIRSYRLTDVSKPYDVIHYETVTAIPPGVRTVLFKYLIHNTNATATRASGLYSVRMEVDHRPVNPTPAPIDVTLSWKEVRSDRTTVPRSHHQRIGEFPFKYIVNVGGSDHPVMESLTLNAEGSGTGSPFGYSDGVDAGGQKYLYTKQTIGTNWARGMTYTISRAPSGFQSSAPASNTTILTDGVVGSPVTGSFSYWLGQCWASGSNVDLRVDLGQSRATGAFRAHVFGYPVLDALKGEVRDRIEVLTSLDGAAFTSRGVLQTSLWRKTIPINYMLQDDEKATAWNFELTLPSAVSARYVLYRITPQRTVCVSELQALDRIAYEPFDIRIAPPAAFTTPTNVPPSVALTAPAAGSTFTAPATIVIAASASDSDGTISRVDFFAGGTAIGSATASPFAITWPAVPAGQYVLTARATDNAGTSTTSGAVTVAVQNTPGNVPPAVSVTTPTNGSRFTAPATISVIADATDPDGTVARVEFFAGATSLGASSATPYTVTWLNAPAGQYSLTAVATDSKGASTRSAAVGITIATAGTALPAPWLTQDVGSVGLTGSASFDTTSATYTVTGAGADIWGAADAFRYVYQTLAGDGQIVARVASVPNTNVWVKAGVMIRGDLTPGSPQAMMMVTPGKGNNFQRRLVAGGTSTSTAGALVTAPYWVKLTRSGATISAYQSADGASWSLVGTATITLPATALIGLAVSSHSTTTLATATFNQVTVSRPPLPTPWLTQDVGAVGLTGSTSFDSSTSTYKVAGAGADIWGTSDAFRYVYQPLAGDGTIVARVASVQATNAWVKAGVMIRGDLTTGSAQAMMMVTPAKGNNFQRRRAAGGTTTSTAGLTVTAPYWVKVTRSGATVSAYQSSDGTTWVLVGTDAITLPANALVGLAVSSHSTTTLATAAFDHVTVTRP
jgi:regulation of enolase protein 1 (concanavalin A-like superfamily)